MTEPSLADIVENLLNTIETLPRLEAYHMFEDVMTRPETEAAIERAREMERRLRSVVEQIKVWADDALHDGMREAAVELENFLDPEPKETIISAGDDYVFTIREKVVFICDVTTGGTASWDLRDDGAAEAVVEAMFLAKTNPGELDRRLEWE